MKKSIFAFLFLLLIFIPSCFAKDGLYVGGSLDIDVSSSETMITSGSINIEYKPVSIFSLGLKASGKTDFAENLIVSPSAFLRFYPVSNTFLEGSLGGSTLWSGKDKETKMVAGASLGWRVESGKTYIEPKVNIDYIFDAEEPFSWSAGIGAGYTF